MRSTTEGRPAVREAALALVLPDRGLATAIVTPRLLRVVRAAIVACQLADDLLAVGAGAGAGDLLALCLELGQPPPCRFALIGEIDAAACAAQRLGENEILVAVVAFEVRAALLIGLLSSLSSFV